MNKPTRIAALMALAIAGPAMATDFSYHYIEGGLILADQPGNNDGKGLGVAGSIDLPQLYQNATGYGGVRYIDSDGGNLLNLEGGLGFHWPLARIVDFTGGLALEVNKYTGGSDLGFGLNAGVRARPFSPDWELKGGLKHVDVGHYEDTSVVLGARYTIKPGMSAGVELDSGDVDYWTLSLRWEL